ncbi:DUF4306 domain-containing protein [Alteribacillus sp. JSM 102045]|uniref:DUF4306 domain-containing protein n=1 Tax=Alteribacillus sp. JSM 102045 TaxID=1562101 RepID=UPI0035BFAA2A
MIVQLALASVLFIFATICAWYEGSEIFYKTFEWNRSTFFSNLNGNVIRSKDDIHVLDHFVYAAKFKPIFPLLMTFSLAYILFLVTFLINRNSLKLGKIIRGILGLFYFAVCILFLNSSTIGGKILLTSCLIIGTIFLIGPRLKSFIKFHQR